MARSTKSLVTRQDLIDMSEEGLLLLRPGTNVSASGISINKVLSREEISELAYIFGNNYDIGGGVFTAQIIGEGGSLVGFDYDAVSIDKFTPDPSVDGRTPNSGSITTVFTSVPKSKNRMTHYGIDSSFADYIISPPVSTYSKTLFLSNERDDNGLFTATLTVGKSGTTPTRTYTRSSTGSTNLSGNIRLGNFVNFSLTPPSVWTTGGILILEVWENGILQFTKNVNIAPSSSSSLVLNDYKIQFGINYEFKGKSIMITEYDGAFSNVTGQRACSVNNS
jgi:hypothetical protein